MSKKLISKDIGSYTFDASEKKVIISGIYDLQLKEILTIINITKNIIIYSPINPLIGITSFTFNSPNYEIILSYNTTSMSDTDELYILIEYMNLELSTEISGFSVPSGYSEFSFFSSGIIPSVSYSNWSSSSVSYSVNDKVKYTDNKFWICTYAHTSNVNNYPGNVTYNYWSEYLPSFIFDYSFSKTLLVSKTYIFKCFEFDYYRENMCVRTYYAPNGTLDGNETLLLFFNTSQKAKKIFLNKQFITGSSSKLIFTFLSQYGRVPNFCIAGKGYYK